MWTWLADEITQLALESRGVRIYDPAVTKELTMIVGYAHMLEVDWTASGQTAAILRKHVQAFSILVGRPRLIFQGDYRLAGCGKGVCRAKNSPPDTGGVDATSRKMPRSHL
jgi:hypothetical protein